MKMKKLICTILTATLLFSMLSLNFGVAGAETGSLLSEGQEGLLRYLGITLSGDVVAYDKQVTRGEMAHILARVSNVPEYTGDGSYFYDVPMTYLYAKDILALVDAGVLHGDGDGNYRPGDPISDAEISKVFVTTLGYKNLEDMATYQKVARISGITDGTNMDGVVTYGEALAMAYNTLHCGMFEGVSYGDDPISQVNANFLALEMYHGLVYRKGIMNGISGTSLTHANDDVLEGQVLVNGKVYTYADENLLGHSILYYVNKKTINQKAPEIVYAHSDAIKTKTLTVARKDIIGKNASGELVYYENDDETEVKIKDVPDIIYNGVAYPQCTMEELKNGSGTVTLVDNDEDNVYDVILVTAYEYVVVDSVNPDKQIIYGEYPAKIYGSEDQDANLFLKYGAANAYLGVIQGGDVLAIQSSKNTTGTLKIRVNILSAGTVGIVESISGDYITIGGKTYERHSGITMDYAPALGETVTVYTYKGDCAAIIHAENDSYQWGYLLGIADLGTTFTSKISVRLANRDRTISEYALADKIILDGIKRVSGTDFDVIATWLEDSAKESYRVGAEGLPYAQMIRFKLNNKGLITEIDTAYVAPGVEDPEKTLHISYSLADSITPEKQDPFLQYIATNMMFVDFQYAAGERAVFGVASNNDLWKIPSAARDDMEKWSVSQGLGGDTLYNVSQEGVLEAYNVDGNTSVAKMTILYEPSTSGISPADNNSGRPGIVSDIAKVLDKDGFIVTQIGLLGMDTGTTTLILPEDVEGAGTLAIGDIIDVVSSNGEIVAMTKHFSVKDSALTNWNDKDKDDLTGYRADMHLAYGMAVSLKDGYLRHTETLDLVNTSEADYKNYSTLKTSSASYFIYDSEKASKGVQAASAGDLLPYRTKPDTKQKTIICTANGKLLYVYIVQ